MMKLPRFATTSIREISDNGWIYCLDLGDGFVKVGKCSRSLFRRYGAKCSRSFLFAIPDSSLEPSVHRLLQDYRLTYFNRDGRDYGHFDGRLDKLSLTKKDGYAYFPRLEIFKTEKSVVLAAMKKARRSKFRLAQLSCQT